MRNEFQYKHYRVYPSDLAAALDAINDSEMRTGVTERIIAVTQNDSGKFTIFVESDE